MTAQRGLRLFGVLLLVGLVGCTTRPPFVSLSGVPATINQGESVSPTATGGPGSSSGLWFYNFSSSCGGTFSPAMIGPTNATTVQTVYDSTGAALGPCVLTVRLTTASGRMASASANTTILAGPTVAWLLTGNAGTDPSTNFLGTTDAQPLILRTNNTEALRIDIAQRVGIGTNNPQDKLHVVGNLRVVGSIIIPKDQSGTNQARIDNTGKGFFNGGTQSGGADFAESMRTTDDPASLEPGDVLVIDPQKPRAVKKSTEANSRLVAGVYSTKPAVLAIGERHIDDSLEGEVPVAIVGIVPVKVTAENGPIHIGDLLVTSSTPGHAMKAKPMIINGIEIYPTGAILGKALEPLEEGAGVIKVLVTLR
jgi:hypothetical protein